MKEKLLLFDIDGVIIDSFETLRQAISDFLVAQGKQPIDADKFRQYFEGNALQSILKDADTVLEDLKSKRAMRTFYGNYNNNQIYPEIKGILEQLAKKHLLVSVTSTLIDQVMRVFDREGISGLFAAHLGPKAAISKTEKIQMAMEEFEKDASNTYFITDTLGDLLEAKQTGVHRIAVTWGFHGKDMLKKGEPEKIVHLPEELFDVLAG